MSEINFVKLKSKDYIEKQIIAGKCVSKCFSILNSLINEKTQLSTLEISRLIENEIINQKCIPTFKNYKSFPESVCISVNNQILHGIPNNYILKEGDKVTFDFGATFEGSVADAARTYIYGENKKIKNIINTAKKCLYESIKQIKINNKTGIIGHTIYKIAKDNGFNVITSYGGHGIGDFGKPHDDPFVCNKSLYNEGITIQPGLSIAIEPILIPINCSTKTKIGKDNWSIYSEEIGVHEENTVTINEDGKVEIITNTEEDYG